MKKLIILLFCTSVFSCCTNSILDDEQLEFAETDAFNASEDHTVKYSDILTLCQRQNNGTRSFAQTTPRVECITNESEDTVLYVSIKQAGGWTIYSSDTRVPAIVAQSDNGSFQELMQVDGAKLWIQSMAEDMAFIKNLPDEKLNFTEEEIACNKAFWKSISSPDQYVKENLLKETRGFIPPGHYEFLYSTTYTEVYDSIPRMIVTDWDQHSPFNIYCPLKSNSNSIHAPAGCAAIGGAQMLYFLHYHFGVPSTAPSEAYCNGNVNSYTWDQTNYTTEIWDYMNNYEFYAAPLIANVGNRLNMVYGDDGSSAFTSDLVDDVFEPYGISCTYTNYDTELLRNSLISGMPVLLSAYSIDNASTVGHVFIADRYKRSRVVTKNCYEWVYDEVPPNTPIPYVPNKIVYTYSSPYINMIGFNWGWGPYYNVPSEWFSLTGDWVSCRYEMSSYNWNINRHMIYNFQVINN